jgi:hypothetical protein
MREVVRLLLAAVVGAVIALSGVALASDGEADQAVDAEMRVIAEGRFQGAVLDMYELYGDRIEEEFGIDVPAFEGPEPCVAIDDDELRDACINSVSFDP